MCGNTGAGTSPGARWLFARRLFWAQNAAGCCTHGAARCAHSAQCFITNRARIARGCHAYRMATTLQLSPPPRPCCAAARPAAQRTCYLRARPTRRLRRVQPAASAKGSPQAPNMHSSARAACGSSRRSCTATCLAEVKASRSCSGQVRLRNASESIARRACLVRHDQRPSRVCVRS